MPSSHEIPGTPQEWLARAKSNLALAKVEKPEEIVWEDLCYNAQQAAEKAVKAVLQHHGILFRYVHDLEELITKLEENSIAVPEDVKEADSLTQYAVELRYPGEDQPATEEEYQQALKIAERVYAWAEAIIAQPYSLPTTP
jgi:HEPN domain-containing protein